MRKINFPSPLFLLLQKKFQTFHTTNKFEITEEKNPTLKQI